MRRTAVLLIAVAAALAAAPPAAAYRLQPHRWYSSTLTYHDATGVYREQVRAAVRAWNASGARVRLRSAPRSSARVSISVDPRLRAAGEARYPVFGGIVTRAAIRLRSDLGRGAASRPEARATVTAVIAHELGHVLGLDHEDRRCALMNSSLWRRCESPAERWRYRCRILEADDVRGVVRRFGGRVRARGAAFCAAEPAPGTPAGLTVTTVAPDTGLLRVAWRRPAGAARVRVLRRDGACPSGRDDPQAELVGVETGEALEDFVPEPGRYCYAVMGEGPLGRPGPPATVAHDLAGPPPVAGFDWDAGPLGISFFDLSYDPDGTIVAWHWDFGDGTSSSEPDPEHAYAAPGEYTVTLTVTDDSGQVSAASQVIRAG